MIFRVSPIDADQSPCPPISLQHANDAAQLGSWQYDPLRRVYAFDARCKEVLGALANQATVEEFMSWVQQDDAAKAWACLNDALDPAEPRRYGLEFPLIDRKIIPREEMSMQRIREWMQDHPDEAKDVRRQNRSVVFFRIVGLTEEGEAIGAQGIPLSAGWSIAVDRALHVYGTPFFIETELPTGNGRRSTPFRRTMVPPTLAPRLSVRLAPTFVSPRAMSPARWPGAFAKRDISRCCCRASSTQLRRRPACRCRSRGRRY